MASAAKSGWNIKTAIRPHEPLGVDNGDCVHEDSDCSYSRPTSQLIIDMGHGCSWLVIWYTDCIAVSPLPTHIWHASDCKLCRCTATLASHLSLNECMMLARPNDTRPKIPVGFNYSTSAAHRSRCTDVFNTYRCYIFPLSDTDIVIL